MALAKDVSAAQVDSRSEYVEISSNGQPTSGGQPIVPLPTICNKEQQVKRS
jgi:hypothetical protein